jgi:60 kDa SS-A/Ro ribonucleoprotein
MNTYLDAITPQSTPVKSHEGGDVFQVDDFVRMRRFLILGTEGGTLYAGERELTIENVDSVRRCLDLDPVKAINMIVEVSDEGLAPSNDPAILALAIASAHPEERVRRMALAHLSSVCRTGTHLMHFMAYTKKLRKSSRMLRTAVGKWFNDMPAEKLAYQAVKYKSRDGWSLADILRLARPTPPTKEHAAIYKYIVDGEVGDHAPDIIKGAEFIKGPDFNGSAVEIVRGYRLPREAVPTELLYDADVWAALLDSMPLMAMIRNLGKMTSIGLISQGSDAARLVRDRLGDQDYLRKSRVHPIAILAALKTYQSGKGFKGSLSWNPVKTVVTDLDEAFYAAFGNVTPAGKRILIGLDVSSSMVYAKVNGMPYMTAREAATAMALVTAATEPHVDIMAYSDVLVPVNITPSMRLDEVMRITDAIDFGGTDCRLPIFYAGSNDKEYDAFISYTDSETRQGYSVVANGRKLNSYRDVLNSYRKMYVKNARSIVVGVSANEFSLNDPLDRYGLDVVGFDTSAPAVISDFIAGRS